MLLSQYVLYYVFYFVKLFYTIFKKILGKMTHNVLAVCDGLAARIRALRSKDQGRQTVAEVLRGNGAAMT
jgi:hypothetical protein